MPETTLSPETLLMRLHDVRQRIGASLARARRAPEEVTLIVVSKTRPTHILQQAIEAGASDFGENRAQEAEEKILTLGRGENVRWHLIGHLQSNKARRAVKLFDYIHSVDSAELIQRLDRLCSEEGRDALPVLLQVSLVGEATKAGTSEEELPDLVEAVGMCKHLRLAGLMTLPPFYEDAELARPFFRRLRELRDGLQSQGVFQATGGELSMGMSNDYEVAIEEGATMVRVGTAIFGQRTVAA